VTFFWLRESEHAPATPIPHADCHFVAASFDAFMNAFEEYK